MNPVDQVTIDTPQLYLPIDDSTILQIVAEAEGRANQDYLNRNIQSRASENINFWLGNQVDGSKLDARYQQAHIDNVVFDDLEDQLKLASSHMPDIFVAPPDKQDYNMESARDIQQWLRERIDSSTIKRLIKNGLRHMKLEMLAAIKPRWDYAKADFVFELVNQKDLRFSQGSKIVEDGYTIDGTDILWHYIEEPTNVVLAKFKSKSDALMQEIGAQNNNTIPARIRYTELQFRWYDRQGRLGEAVAWRYGNLILDKMRNPYYDYDNPEINYFDRPRKTMILLSYLNLGDSVYEATSDFEQGKPINRIINKRRRQVTEISDRAVPKLAFAGNAMTKETAANISPSPNEGILLNDLGEGGDIRKAMFIIPATPPNPILYNDMLDLRSRLDRKFNTQGQQTSQTSASASGISKQISREGDMVTSDDIVDIVVERVVSEMAGWAMQFARLFYDDDRPPVRIPNGDNETSFIALKRDKIETDVQVRVKASTTDKTTRRADALQMLGGKITDPYTMFEDLDVPNPKERTKRLLAFIQAQQAGNWDMYAQAIGLDMTDQAGTDEAQRDIEVLMQGQQLPINKVPSEGYVSTFMAFVQGPEFMQLPVNIKQLFQAHVQALRAKLQQATGGQGGDPNAQGPAQAQNMAQQQPQALPPGMQGQVQYQPQTDVSTQFGGNMPPGQYPFQQLMQRIQYPVTQATQPGVTG